MVKRAVLLARVSTTGQSDNFSIPTQLAAMREYAARHDFSIIGEFTDDHTGTVPVAERPGGRQVYDLLRKHAVDVVILYTIDRVARDEDVLEYGIFKRDCKRAGAELHFCDTGKTADSIMGSLIEHFKAAAAAEELQKIRERSQRGRMAKVKAGKWIGIKTPFGYRKIGMKRDARLEPEPVQVSLLRRIFAMYLGKEGYKPLSMHLIAYTLTKDGIPTPRGARPEWGQTTIRALLTNRLFIGEVHFAGHVTVMPELAIIPRAWFDQAQLRLEKNRRLAQRNRKHEYLLSNRIRCACGRSMYGITRGNDLQYYRCSGNLRGHAELRMCSERMLKMRIVDERFWNKLLAELDEAKIEEGVRARTRKLALELEPKQQRLQAVNELIERAEKRVRKLMNAFADSDDETISAEFEVSIKEATRQRDALNAERTRLEIELAQSTLTQEDINTIKATVATVRGKIQGGGRPSFAQKRYLLDILDVQAHLVKSDGKRRLDVACILDVEPLSVDITNC